MCGFVLVWDGGVVCADVFAMSNAALDVVGSEINAQAAAVFAECGSVVRWISAPNAVRGKWGSWWAIRSGSSLCRGCWMSV